MLNRTLAVLVACWALGACASTDSTRPPDRAAAEQPTAAVQPLVIGDVFTIDSRIMGEPRPINVFTPTIYGEKIDTPLPILYMLDGGLNEDFLHIAGLVQILVCNSGMRPFMLVGIPNTQRRRDMTGPTSVENDRKIAPVVGGSATFRRFIKEELIPTIRARYRTTDEAAIIGESLAGLFVIETYFLEPDLFGTYIAFDPSLWWNDHELIKAADARLVAPPSSPKTIFLASSNEPELAASAGALARAFESHRREDTTFHYAPLATESHATIYHPAALLALRTVFAPPPAPPK